MEILTSQLSCAVEALGKAGARPRDVAAIGITNQRETVIVWDRATGKPIHPAIVWQDRRTAPLCAELEQSGAGEDVANRTGLVLDPYFSATKIRWILDNVPRARDRANRGELAFGTVDSWLIWNLTSGHQHVTDVTNASRTLLFNIVDGRWDPELLRLFQIPESMLPEVAWSSQRIADVTTTLGLGGVTIAGIAGDQQAALFGQLCWSAGQAKNTYGTGCFLLQNIGTKFVRSRHKLITTVAASAQSRLEYALEGSIFIGGAVVQWLRDNLRIIGSSAGVEALAASVPDTGGVVFVPAFVGLGAPHWDPHAAGLLIGLRRDTHPGHIARAALESIAFQVADVLEAVHSETGEPLAALRVDGGAAVNNLLMQFQADVLGVPVLRPRVTETTALGAAYLAGLATGCWDSPGALRAARQGDTRFDPKMDATEATARRAQWQRAVARSRDWLS
jgi:glycerol kinase